MTHIVPKLQNQLETLSHLMDASRLLTLSDDEQRSLREQTTELARRLERAESEPLTVGMLGGTGVGKSTLLNALAGEEISATSHRRPRTDQVIVYRHAEAKPLSSDSLANVPWKEVMHKNDAVGKILLCDLPDFDSIEAVHRQRVLQFLGHLDLLIWVTSPEKYADQQFYAFLAEVPKSQKNFYFVLNKLDLIFQEKPSEEAYQELNTMSQAFHSHLRENGVVDPLVFFVSARDSLNGQVAQPWNHFSSFKKQVFQERRLKEVTVIKATNLDVEVQELIHRFQGEVEKLETFEKTLVQSIDHLQSQKKVWQEEWLQTVTGWVESHVLERMRRQRPDPVPLVGPGRTLYVMIDRIKSGGEKNVHAESPETTLAAAVLPTFEAHLESLETRLNTERLRRHLPKAFETSIDRVLARQQRCERLGENLSRTLAWHMGRAPWPFFWGFKMWQGVCYALILGVFLVAIGGETAWGDFFDNPGLKPLGHLFLAVIHTLFSGKGFAALGSYIILNGFVALRFYRRMSTLTGRVVENRGTRLVQAMVVAWEGEMENLMDAIRETGKAIEEERARILTSFHP